MRAADYTIAARHEVPFRPQFLAFTADNARIVAVSLGQMSRNKKKQITPMVSLLEVATGRSVAQVPLTSAPLEPWTVGDRMFIPCGGFQMGTPVAPEMAVLNMSSGAVEKIPLPSAPVRWHDAATQDFRYLELENHVAVVGADGKLSGDLLTAGDELLLFVPTGEASRYFMAGKTKKQGQLSLVEDGRVVRTASIPVAEGAALDGRTGRLIVCSSKECVVVDTRTLAEIAKLPPPGTFREIMLDPSQARLYVNKIDDAVVVVDLESKRQVGRFTSGREGKKMLLALAAVTAQTLSQAQYQLTGVPGIGSTATVPLAVQNMAFSPSGNFVYVFNDVTADVTVVETKTFTNPLKVATGPVGVFGPRPLWLAPNGERLFSIGLNKMLVFDMEKGALLAEAQFPKATVRYEPNFGLLLVVAKEGLDVYQPAPLKKLKSFPPATEVLFQPDGRIFFAVGERGVSVVDYDLNVVEQIDGLKKPDLIRGFPLTRVEGGPKIGR